MYYILILCNILFIAPRVVAQTKAKIASGIVEDEKGLPLIGASVALKGTNIGTITDINGAFSISVSSVESPILSISFIGYITKEVKVTTEVLRIKLVEESNQLKEVVVQVGYGTVKKKDATGSVSVIKAEDFNKGPNVTAESLINGRIAGVNVTGGGAPGAKADIRIRGGSSLNASNEPLIILDGLPMSNAVPSGATSVLSTIDPNDIESFTVLKDASAAAIYGSRAANGVIVITTKKGAKGGMKVAFNSQVGISTLADKVDVLDANQFRALVNEKGNAAQKAILGTANTDWQNEIFSTAITTNNNISVSGALFNKLPARLSVGHTNTPGILNNTSFERTTTSIALNPTFFDNHLKIDISGNLSFGKNRFQDEKKVIGSAISFDPTQSVYQAGSRYGGYFEWLEANGNVALLPAKNPVAMLNQIDNRATSTRKWGNIRLDYKFHFFEDLRFVAEAGIDRFDSNGFIKVSDQSITGYQPKSFSSGEWVNLGGYSHYTDARENKNLNTYFNYIKEIGKFKVDVTAGYNYQLFSRVGFDSFQTVDPSAKAPDFTTDPDINLQSYFGRLNLGYDGRYLLTINHRRDGTSRFSEANRWGNFSGAAFAWNITNESFMKDNKTFSNLKLRLGYGVTGQQDISASYDYLRRATLGTTNSQYIFGNTAYTVAKIEGFNPNIKWEQTKELNIGLDYGLFDNKVSGSLNYFHKKSDDLLASIAYPDGANLRNEGFANIGSFSTKGVEFSIESNIIKNDNLKWNVAFNTTYLDQKVDDLGITVPSFQGYTTGDIAGGSNNKIQINTVGYEPRSFYVYEQVYDANHKPIQGSYVDRNKDGVVDNLDRYRYKNPTADFTFGFATALNYKRFDFSMNWRASVGNYVFDNISSDKGYLQAALRRDTDLANITTDYYNTGFNFEDNGTSRYLSDYFVKNASFIKLDNVTVGYTLDKSLLKTFSLHLTAGIQNALIISKYKGLDPEIFSGIDGNIYPRARTYVFGLNANF